VGLGREADRRQQAAFQRAHRPADECPYPKPFAADFDDCSAYRPSEYVGLDTQYQPLPAVWTCRHLQVGVMPGMASSHYARCRLGTAEQRQAWVAGLLADRVAALRDLSREISVVVGPQLRDLWRAKGRQLSSAFDPQAAAELQKAVDEISNLIEIFLDENQDRMTGLGLPPEATRALIREALAEWVRSPTAEASALELSDESLDRFPPEIRDFLRPPSRPSSALR
jgi:hypothetical protein